MFVAQRAFRVGVDDGGVAIFVVLFEVLVGDLLAHKYRSVFYADVAIVF